MAEPRVAMERKSAMPKGIESWLKGVTPMPIEYVAHVAYVVPANSTNSNGPHHTLHTDEHSRDPLSI
jgi:hypothetical protein